MLNVTRVSIHDQNIQTAMSSEKYPMSKQNSKLEFKCRGT
jgi:hypothetical protein